MRIVVLFIISLIFLSCSSNSSAIWMQESSGYLEKFKTLKLQGKEYLTIKQKAIDSAKMGANIEYLQIIELSDIALDLILNNTMDFSRYDHLETLETFEQNKNYKAMLQGKSVELNQIPKQYRSFAKSIDNNDTKKAFNEAKNIINPISKLIALSIISSSNIEIELEIINIATEQGYKAVIINRLNKIKDIEKSQEQKEKLEKLIKELY